MRPGLLELRWAYGLFALLILESCLLAWLAPRPVVWALLPPVLLTLGVAAWLAPRLVAMLRGHRELKESYAQELGFARQIMETVEHGLTVSDEDGRFVYVNPAYARMLDLTPEQVVGRSPFEWTLPEDQEQVLKDMGEAFAADQLVQRMWDGPSPTNDDRRWIADVTERLATRYDLDLPQTVPALLQEWRAASRPSGREFGGGHRRRR